MDSSALQYFTENILNLQIEGNKIIINVGLWFASHLALIGFHTIFGRKHCSRRIEQREWLRNNKNIFYSEVKMSRTHETDGQRYLPLI